MILHPFKLWNTVDDLAGARRATPKDIRVCLVTALSLSDFVDPELTVRGAGQFMAGNIGVLTLAAVLREKGLQPKVLNLDSLFLDFRGNNRTDRFCKADRTVRGTDLYSTALNDTVGNSTSFFQFVIQRLEPFSCEFFGFSSICSSYPLTLRLAQWVKSQNLESRIVIGGPQASVVDEPTMQNFSCVDFVLRGEAEHTFPALLECLASADGSSKLECLPGLTFRRDDRIIRNPNAPVLEDLDCLPLPAFDLDPDLKNRESIYLELGRGCPFACTFCSTNDFFRRNFRLKSAPKMVLDMKLIKQESGIGNFSLIHDMFTVDRKRVVAFCEAILASGEDFTWACSARTDCVDDELIALMARAGCRGIFFGIETGSERLQRVIRKNLDLRAAIQRIECTNRHGIKTAVALITAFPDETLDDLRDTIHFFVDSLRFDHAAPQLSLLAPLAGTPLQTEYRNELALDYVFSDISHQGWQQDSTDLEMIRSCPDVFPNFYAVPTFHLPRSYFKEVRDFVTYLTTWFRWLPVAMLQDSGDLLKVFDAWKEWLHERKTDEGESAFCAAPYYCCRQFRNDFLEFVRTSYLDQLARARSVIRVLIQTEGGDEAGDVIPASADAEPPDALDLSCVPFRQKGFVAMALSLDYKELIDRLRSKTDLESMPEQNVTVLFRPKDQWRTEVWQLSPSSAALMRHCDGKRTVQEIIGELAWLGADQDELPLETVCLFGLVQLQQEGLIGISHIPLTEEELKDRTTPIATSIMRYSPPPEASNTQQPWPWLT